MIHRPVSATNKKDTNRMNFMPQKLFTYCLDYQLSDQCRITLSVSLPTIMGHSVNSFCSRISISMSIMHVLYSTNPNDCSETTITSSCLISPFCNCNSCTHAYQRDSILYVTQTKPNNTAPKIKI